MRQRRRSEIELFLRLIEELHSSPAILTHLMYKTNINCTVISKFLKILQNSGYVTITKKYQERYPLGKYNDKKKFKHAEYYNQPFVLSPEGEKFFLKVYPAIKEINNLLNIIDAQSYAEEAQRYSDEIDLRLAMQ